MNSPLSDLILSDDEDALLKEAITRALSTPGLIVLNTELLAKRLFQELSTLPFVEQKQRMALRASLEGIAEGAKQDLEISDALHELAFPIRDALLGVGSEGINVNYEIPDEGDEEDLPSWRR